MRTEDGYRALFYETFRDVKTFVREDISRLPYTFDIAIATTPVPHSMYIASCSSRR